MKRLEKHGSSQFFIAKRARLTFHFRMRGYCWLVRWKMKDNKPKINTYRRVSWGAFLAGVRTTDRRRRESHGAKSHT